MILFEVNIDQNVPQITNLLFLNRKTNSFAIHKK